MNQQSRIGMYCASDVIGGAEAAVFNLAVAYNGEHELVIITPSPVVLEAAERIAPTIERHLVTDSPSFTRRVVGLRRDLARLSLDLLQVTLPNPFAARDAQLAAFTLGLPVVTVQQLVFPSQRRRGALPVRLFAGPTKATIAVGRQTARDIEAFFGIPPKKIHVVHNGVAAAAPAPVDLPERPVIGCVARYEEQKALHRLIDLLPELPNIRLMLVGDGSLRADLQRQAQRLGVNDRVDFAGWREDARAFAASFDLFVLPSVDEAFPLTIVEAMLARTPVIATDVGSVREAVIHERTGLLVASGSQSALIAAVRRLLDDPQLASDLADEAYALAHRSFTSDAMASGYAAVWRQVLSATR